MSDKLRFTTSEDQAIADIEAIIDGNDVEYVLNVVAKVCGLKADHIMENWQDDETSQHWDNMGVTISQFSELLNAD